MERGQGRKISLATPAYARVIYQRLDKTSAITYWPRQNGEAVRAL